MSDLVSIVDKSSFKVKSFLFGDVKERHVGETDRDFLALLFLRLLADLHKGEEDFLFVGGLGLADWTNKLCLVFSRTYTHYYTVW